MPGTGPGSLQRGRPVPRVTVRTLTEDDVPDLAALLAADREHLAPWDPQRPGEYSTEDFQRADVARLLELHRQGVAPRYLRIAGRWQDHLLFQLLADETATPGMR